VAISRTVVEKAIRPMRMLRFMMYLDQAMGMIGTAVPTAMAAKNNAPTSEKAMRWAVSKRIDMKYSFDGRAPDHPAADIE
jgi:hypothetical protein